MSVLALFAIVFVVVVGALDRVSENRNAEAERLVSEIEAETETEAYAERLVSEIEADIEAEIEAAHTWAYLLA